MPVNVNFNNSTYTVPLQGENYGWGAGVTSYLQALAVGLAPGTGLFPLSAELSFGDAFGIKAAYFKSNTAFPAAGGKLRLARTDSIAWRNQANSDDLTLSISPTEELLFKGIPVSSAGGGLPVGGNAGQVLSKIDATNYNVQWTTPSTASNPLPVGGAAGQVLSKIDAANYNTQWTTLPSPPLTPIASGAGGIRNRIQNGMMGVSQRMGRLGVRSTIAGITYGVDRFRVRATQAAKLRISQSPDSPFASGVQRLGYSTKIEVESAAAVAAGDAFYLEQIIAADDIVDLAFGSSIGSPVVLSFYVKGTVPGTYSASLRSSPLAPAASYVGTYTVSTNWTRVSIQIPAPPTDASTWSTDRTGGLFVRWDLGTGANYNTTAGSWLPQEYVRTSGSVQLVTTGAAALWFTGVQLEAGTAPTPVEVVPYALVLEMCKRWYQRSNSFSTTSYWSGPTTAGANYFSRTSFETQMITIPALTLTVGTQSGFPATAGTVLQDLNGFQETRTANSAQSSGHFITSWTADADQMVF